MILAVDAGNSRIKWGLWDRRWVRQDAVATDELARLGEIWASLPRTSGIVACNVAGPALRDWVDAWADRRGERVLWVESRIFCFL